MFLCILCILYISCVISSAPAALCVLVLETEIFDMNQDAKSQPKDYLCICVYTLKIHTWVCLTIWYAVPGQSCGSLMKPQSVIAVV